MTLCPYCGTQMEDVESSKKTYRLKISKITRIKVDVIKLHDRCPSCNFSNTKNNKRGVKI